MALLMLLVSATHDDGSHGQADGDGDGHDGAADGDDSDVVLAMMD